ncbi:hypothetical protein BpHYR1_041698 [Brachionus plicatilis]|uniref:Uncharacterized protein n=1 Tax=Brachionus plicatilis TaxID=10195 RepID=A0A3M7Q235_BRAPC|nr:hypothetical protein BpHYR1_041698 [Brachionus plicatilis]
MGAEHGLFLAEYLSQINQLQLKKKFGINSKLRVFTFKTKFRLNLIQEFWKIGNKKNVLKMCEKVDSKLRQAWRCYA